MSIQPNLNLTSAPATTAITVAESKNFMRIDETADDTLIGTMISAATKYIESFIDMKLITQTWEVFYDCFPYKQKDDWWDGEREVPISYLYSTQRDIILPIGKIISLTSFLTYDDAAVAYTFDSSQYTVDNVNQRARVSLNLGSVWPATVLRPTNGIKLTGVFGFGNAAAVPDDIKLALHQMTSFLYENRGELPAEMPYSIALLLQSYRRMKVGR